MDSTDKHNLIISVLMSIKGNSIVIGDISEEKIISKYQSFLDADIINCEDMYTFLKSYTFGLPRYFSNSVIRWMITQIAYLVTSSDVERMIDSNLSLVCESEIYETFRDIILELPFDTLPILRIYELYGEDKTTEHMNNLSIDCIANELISDGIDHDKELDLFFRDYLLNRLDEIKALDDIESIYNIFSIIGEHILIDEQFEAAIITRKYSVLELILEKSSMGMDDDRHRYIVNMYEQITGESICIGTDIYTTYIYVFHCGKRPWKNYCGKIMIHKLFFNLTRDGTLYGLGADMREEARQLSDARKSFETRYTNISHNTSLFEEEAEKFDKLTKQIEKFVSKLVCIETKN